MKKQNNLRQTCSSVNIQTLAISASLDFTGLPGRIHQYVEDTY